MHSFRTQSMAGKLKNMENEKHTLQDWKVARKNSKTWIMRNAHGSTWNMARKLKIVDNETQTLFDMEYGEKHSIMWKMRNEQLQDIEYGRKIEKYGK